LGTVEDQPDVLLRVQFRAFIRRQRDERDVGRDGQAMGEMPAGLIKQHDGLRARRDLGGDFGQMQGRRFGVAARHDETCALALFRTDRAENGGRGGSLVFEGAGPGSPLGPEAGDLV
jgi:hypothetical protein